MSRALSDTLIAATLGGLQGAARALPSVPAQTQPEPPHVFTPFDDDSVIRYPIVERGMAALQQKLPVTREEFDELIERSQQHAAFTVSQLTEEAVQRVQDAVVETLKDGPSLKQFRERMHKIADAAVLPPARVELIYRHHVRSAFSDGVDKTLAHPVARGAFPYVRYVAVHDARARKTHLALERHGIQGTAIYRTDDPVIRMFRPPWDYNCRCDRIFLTLRQAARAGIKEAQVWLETGIEPTPPAFVPWPPFLPPAGWERAA